MVQNVGYFSNYIYDAFNMNCGSYQVSLTGSPVYPPFLVFDSSGTVYSPDPNTYDDRITLNNPTDPNAITYDMSLTVESIPTNQFIMAPVTFPFKVIVFGCGVETYEVTTGTTDYFNSVLTVFSRVSFTTTLPYAFL